MRLLHLVLISALYISSTWALHESEVGVVDWHKRLIGVPLSGSPPTAPTFHRVGNSKSTKSVVLTATGNNVLAALNPVNGSVDWRYVFESEDRIASFHKHGDVVAVLSGPGGAILRSFDVLKGHLILEKKLHASESGQMAEPSHLGTAVAFASSVDHPDMYVLTNGHTIRNVDGTTGEVKWAWVSPDQSSLVVYSQVIATTNTIYLVGLAKSFASYTLHVTTLSRETGEVISTTDIPSSIKDGLVDFLIVRRSKEDAVTPRIVWLEQESIKSVGLTPTLGGKSTTIKGSAYKSIVDVGLSEHGQLVAIKTDGSSRILKLDADGSGIKSIWEYAESAASEQVTPSIFAGGLDKDGYPYVARVYWSHALQKAAVDVFCSHLADGKGLVTGYTFPFDTSVHGIISHVAMDAANPDGWKVLARLVLTTTTGAVQLWQHDKVTWTREESLAAISAAEFVELPEKVISSSRLGDSGENFFSRLARQISDAQGFPSYVVSFVKRFATGSYESVSSSAAAATDDGLITRDTFGFRQIIIASTVFGNVFGIDSSNGNLLWSRVLGLGWAAQVGGRVQVVKMYSIRTVSDGDKPQVVLVTQRRAENTLVDTVLFHIDALTGEDVRDGVVPKGAVLQGLDVISGPLVESYLLQNGSSKVVVLLDEFLQVYLYPDTPDTQAAFTKSAPSLHFPLRASATPGELRIMGHQVVLNAELSRRYVAYPTWTLSIPEQETIQSLIPQQRGPVASIGKVLGNRTTLYKYLNPRLFTLLTASHSVSPPTCGLYIVDSAKGTIIYRATIPSSAGVCDIKASFTENWLVYHYFDEDFAGVGQAKGYRMVTVELYEGKGIDDKTKSSDMSAFSNKSVDFTTFEQSYVFPRGVTTMSTTSTKFGITGKDLIVATRDNKIQSFSRRLLNPRRPNRKLTTHEQEELLIQYDPTLPNDPRRVLSHNYEVANIEHILTSPALLESTSLVFAYGLDLFLTRVAPSNTFDVLSENFNKVQLVLTITSLAVAIMFTKPMVQRKRLRERWYQ